MGLWWLDEWRQSDGILLVASIRSYDTFLHWIRRHSSKFQQQFIVRC